MSDRLLWLGAALLWAALTFWLSSQSPTEGQFDWLDRPGLDKVAHALSFGVFAGLLAQALRGAGEVRSLVLAVVIASVYGITDELHQWFVPGRSADVLDWVADTVGAILFVTVVWFLRR